MLRLTAAEAKLLGMRANSGVTNVIKKASKRPVSPAAKKLAAERKAAAPEAILFSACIKRFPDLECVNGLNNAVPGRKFEIDIAFIEKKLAVEMDGWQFHGKFLADFKRDREKDKLLTLQGWRMLRFTAEDVNKHLEKSLGMIADALLLI